MEEKVKKKGGKGENKGERKGGDKRGRKGGNFLEDLNMKERAGGE